MRTTALRIPALLAALLVLCVLPASPAASLDGQIVATPGGFVAGSGYGTRAAVVTTGASATFTNADIALHDVLSTDRAPDGGRLFSTPLIGNGKQADIVGVSALPAGSYNYFCSLHAWMTGTLVVADDPSGGGAPELPELPDLPVEPPAPPPPPPPPPPGPPPPPPPPGGDDGPTWPVYGGDLANSRSSDSGPSVDEVLNLAQAWVYELPAEGDFSGTPIVGDGAVYLGSILGRVVAVDAESGAERWKVDLNREGESAEISATAAYADGVVYVPVSGRQDGVYMSYVVALDSDDGTELWRTYVDDEQPLGDLQGSPVVWETTTPDGQPWRTLYIGTSSYDSGAVGEGELHLGSIVALDLDNGGAIRWRTYMAPGSPQRKADVPLNPDGFPMHGAAVWSTPAIDEAAGLLFFGTGQSYVTDNPLANSLHKMDAFTGELLGQYRATDHDTWNINQPQNGLDADFGASAQLITGPNGELWLGAGQKNNHLVDELTDQADPKAMVGLARYHVIDRETMELVWVTPVGPGYWTGGITGSTAYDGERVYGSDVFGELFGLGVDDGLPDWVVPTGDAGIHFAPTTIANGVVYAANASAQVNAWDAATGLLRWTAPMAGPSWGGVAVVDDTVYVAQGYNSSDGHLYAFRLP